MFMGVPARLNKLYSINLIVRSLEIELVNETEEALNIMPPEEFSLITISAPPLPGLFPLATSVAVEYSLILSVS